MTDEIEAWLRLPHLRQVIPLAHEQHVAGRGAIVITSVEVWQDRLRLHLSAYLGQEHMKDDEDWDGWQVTDSAGTEYDPLEDCGSTAEGRDGWADSDFVFRPAPPIGATFVRIRHAGLQLDLNVPLA